MILQSLNIMDQMIIPTNIVGKPTDLEYTITSDTHQEAVNCFTRACKRLQNPPVWHLLCGALSGTFSLTDSTGRLLSRLAETGDYLQIDMHIPGTKAGKGYDWVNVEAIEADIKPDGEIEYFAMRVRPSRNPTTNRPDTAHFFEDIATSTFIIKRIGNTVTASYHGRNEVPNTETSDTKDVIRNVIVATGAAAGLSELQWSALMKAFLKEEL